MSVKMLAAFVVSLLCLALASAAEEESAPVKSKKKDTHWGGSLVGYVLHLPEVVKWEEYEKSQNPKTEVTAWGEGKGQVDGHDCSYIILGKNEDQEVKILKHFCIADGGSVWIQKYAAPRSEEVPDYIAYDVWLSECAPAADSYGKC